MDLEGREGMGGATEYQVRELATPTQTMREGVEHDIDLAHLEQLLLAEGE